MRILWSVLLLLVLLPSYSGEERLTLWPATFAIRTERVELDWREPARKQLGELTFLGGVRLTSPVHGFGSFSVMSVDRDRFTLLSDGGNFVRFRLNRDWRVSDVSSGALVQGPGTGWRKLDRDSESLAHDPATGSYWVGFEWHNQIWRYDSQFRNGHGVRPAAMTRWTRSGGPETMVRLRDGSFVVLAESAWTRPSRARQGLWFAGDPIRARREGFRFVYHRPPGFAPTDAAELPDWRIVVLHRRASLKDGFTAVLTIVERGSIRPGAIVKGREIARFAAPVVHDNCEGLAVTQEGRDTILWIASDDNQLFFQRSLLLKFRLNQSPERRTARTP